MRVIGENSGKRILYKKKGACIVVAEYLPFKNMALLDNYKQSSLFAHPYIYYI